MIWSEVVGERGPLVVLTTGWGATADMWRPQVDVLAERCRVVVWDLPGHGRSDAPAEPGAYTLFAALDALGSLATEPAVLVGHSLGGVLSMRFAARSPERARALALLSTGPGYRDEAARTAWNADIERQAAALERRGMDALPAGEDLHGGRHRSAHALAAAIRGFVTQHDSSLMDLIPTLDVPALVLVGAKDRGFVAAADYLADRLPRATKVVVPDAGHAVNLHQPAAVNAALLQLLESIDG